MVKKNKKQLAEAAPQDVSVNMNPVPRGSYGTKSWSGYPDEEYFHTLKGRARADAFDKMRRSSPQVQMVLGAVSSPIKAACWEICPGVADDAESEKDAELVRYALFEAMKRPWKEFISEALGTPTFGHALWEMQDRVVDAPEFGKLNIVELLFRSQRSIEKWNLDRATGDLASVTQYVHGDLDRNMVDIPAEFLLVVSLNKEGANYEGISMLRPCYGPWFRQNNYFKMNAAGIENFAVPAPIATIPNGKENSEQFNNLLAALEAWSFHEKRYLTIPEGWTLDFNSNTYDPQKVEVSIDNEDKRIAKAFMANFLELGMNGFGSQSLSFDLSDFFLGTLQHIADLIADRVSQVVIPRLIKLNRGPRARYPYIKVTGIQDKAGKELAEVVKMLADGKIILPDAKLEENMRERYGLPEASEEDRREPVETTPNEPMEPEEPEETPKLSEFLRKRRAR